MTDPDALKGDFEAAAASVPIDGWPCPLRVENLPAPHRQPRLPVGQEAVYVFVLSAAAGDRAPCRPGTVLKVGQVTESNEARFRYYHYNPAFRGSSVARSLIAYPILWPWLGIDHLTAGTVKDWMLASLDRVHFFIPAGHPKVLTALEVYIRARVGSVFEGAAGGYAA